MNPSPDKVTVKCASIELSVSRETITRGLRANGVPTGKGETYTWKQIFDAVAGDAKRERTRKAKADADLAEHKLKKANEDYVSFEETRKFFTETLVIPVRALLTGVPTELCNKVNPGNPAFARKVLEEWVNESMKTLHAGVPKQ